tara:strand:- start:564 stop:962 length:399 start_codon:yes stop_codon:yes gene_type:complete
VLFTIHAHCRWAERFQTSNVDIVDAFNDTFLFGAQHGNARYFLNAKLDAVFCVKEGYVTTVLTKAQAIANMQQNGISFDDPIRVETNKPANVLHGNGVSLREIAKRLGPIRGKILSAQSVKQLISKYDPEVF